MPAITVKDYVTMVLRKDGSKTIQSLHNKCADLGMVLDIEDLEGEIDTHPEFFVDNDGKVKIRD